MARVVGGVYCRLKVQNGWWDEQCGRGHCTTTHLQTLGVVGSRFYVARFP